MTLRHVVIFFVLLALAACAPSLGPNPGDGDDDDTSLSDCREWDEVLNVAHDLCRDAMGDMYYCGPEGICLEASGCEALSCCLPSDQGDTWCQSNFGEGSSCVAGSSDGYCE